MTTKDDLSELLKEARDSLLFQCVIDVDGELMPLAALFEGALLCGVNLQVTNKKVITSTKGEIVYRRAPALLRDDQRDLAEGTLIGGLGLDFGEMTTPIAMVVSMALGGLLDLTIVDGKTAISMERVMRRIAATGKI